MAVDLGLVRETVLKIAAEYERAPWVRVGVSNRHLHISRDDLDILFGAGHSLSPVKELQPGQYACDEKVSLIGKKGRLDNVRILGPERGYTQAEISLTDAYAIGVKVSVSESGDLSAACELTIENPRSGKSVTRRCGIAAQRHIHLSPSSAEKFGLRDKQIVSVRFDGIRSLTMGSVLLRVSSNFADEIHIDTDEANAGCIKNKDLGLIIPHDV